MNKEIFILFLIVFLSCKGREKHNYEILSICNVEKVIPINKTGSQNSWYKYTKQKSEQLKLDNLECGYDSIQIRIWFNYSLAIENHLVVIKKSRLGWKGELIKMKVDSENNQDFDKILEFNVSAINLNEKWDVFFKKLLSLNITEIKNSEDNGADGVTYCVEIATKDRYRFYRVWSPEYTMKTSVDSDNMVQIIQLIQLFFGFNRPQV